MPSGWRRLRTRRRLRRPRPSWLRHHWTYLHWPNRRPRRTPSRRHWTSWPRRHPAARSRPARSPGQRCWPGESPDRARHYPRRRPMHWPGRRGLWHQCRRSETSVALLSLPSISREKHGSRGHPGRSRGLARPKGLPRLGAQQHNSRRPPTCRRGLPPSQRRNRGQRIPQRRQEGAAGRPGSRRGGGCPAATRGQAQAARRAARCLFSALALFRDWAGMAHPGRRIVDDAD